MSLSASRAVWERSRTRGATRLALLAFADCADAEGIAWPSAQTIAERTNCSLRNARKTIKALVAAGELVPIGRHRSGSIKYRIAVCGEVSEPTGVGNDTPNNAGRCRKRQGGSVDIDRGGVSISTPERSIERSLEQGEAAAAEQAVRDFNAVADELGLTKVQRLTARRRKLLNARLAECGGLGGWAAVLARIRDGPGLCGDNARDWKLDPDWLISDETRFARVAEGQYDGWSASGNGKTPGDPRVAAFAAAAERRAARREG